MEELNELKDHFEWLIEEQKNRIDLLQEEVDSLNCVVERISKPFGDLTNEQKPT